MKRGTTLGAKAKKEKKLREQLTCLRGARALIAMSIAIGDIDSTRKGRKDPGSPIISYASAFERCGFWNAQRTHKPGYPAPTKRAKLLARKILDEADRIYNETVGPDDWSPDVEERALERADDYIEGILYDLGIDR